MPQNSEPRQATYTRVVEPAKGTEKRGDVSVIAMHGMGQPIRFEAVETIVRALKRNRDGETHPITIP